jgi:exonuclease VII large subunit
MRSETHSNPVYPDQHALNYSDDVEDTEYELTDWAQKTVNYRVCVITTEKARVCSNVVALEGMTKEDHKEYTYNKYKDKEEYSDKKEYMEDKYEKMEHKKVYTKEKLQSVKKPNIDENLAKRADKMVDNLVARLDKKHGSDTEKKVERLEMIIEKLETLNAKIKSDKTKALVTYITEGLKEALDEMGASDDIEEIFNILEEE